MQNIISDMRDQINRVCRVKAFRLHMSKNCFVLTTPEVIFKQSSKAKQIMLSVV